LKSTCKNSGTFEGKKILPEKVTYVPLAPTHSIVDLFVSTSAGNFTGHNICKACQKNFNLQMHYIVAMSSILAVGITKQPTNQMTKLQFAILFRV